MQRKSCKQSEASKNLTTGLFALGIVYTVTKLCCSHAEVIRMWTTPARQPTAMLRFSSVLAILPSSVSRPQGNQCRSLWWLPWGVRTRKQRMFFIVAFYYWPGISLPAINYKPVSLHRVTYRQMPLIAHQLEDPSHCWQTWHNTRRWHGQAKQQGRTPARAARTPPQGSLRSCSRAYK